MWVKKLMLPLKSWILQPISTIKQSPNYINTGTKIEEIVSKVEEINTLSTQNTRSVEEIAGASEHLNSLTEKTQYHFE